MTRFFRQFRHRLLAENRLLLDRIYRQYGVQPRFLVSFWALGLIVENALRLIPVAFGEIRCFWLIAPP